MPIKRNGSLYIALQNNSLSTPARKIFLPASRLGERLESLDEVLNPTALIVVVFFGSVNVSYRDRKIHSRKHGRKSKQRRLETPQWPTHRVLPSRWQGR